MKNTNENLKAVEKSNNLKNGITLIALVITIVVLVILASVAINLTLGNNGIFNRTKYAKEEYLNQKNDEEIKIAKASNEIDKQVESSRLDTTYNPVFIDTTTLIATVAADTAWGKNSHEYTATQDCAVVGTVGTNSGYNKADDTTTATCTIKINNVNIGQIYSSRGFNGTNICYYLKKGDKIQFACGTDGETFITLKAYALK